MKPREGDIFRSIAKAMDLNWLQNTVHHFPAMNTLSDYLDFPIRIIDNVVINDQGHHRIHELWDICLRRSLFGCLIFECRLSTDSDLVDPRFCLFSTAKNKHAILDVELPGTLTRIERWRSAQEFLRKLVTEKSPLWDQIDRPRLKFDATGSARCFFCAPEGSDEVSFAEERDILFCINRRNCRWRNRH